jgi:phosphoribosylformylglycinamidine synthase
MAHRVIDLAADLAHFVPVLHDISDGGLAVAVAEICIASGVGARISDPGQTAMFSEDPHRFVVVMEGGTTELPADLARRVGTIVGGNLSFGSADLDLSVITRAWREALPSALGVG